MRITILNGTPEGEHNDFNRFLEILCPSLEKENHRVIHLELAKMDIRYCTGCWGCWVKTPGECVFADDHAIICKEAINSDLLIFASPMKMGFISSVLKKTMDRLIPLVHPYIEFVQKEMHHLKRYKNYPAVGLLLGKCGDSDDRDAAITRDIFKRLSLNFKSRLHFTVFAHNPVQEVMDEINAI